MSSSLVTVGTKGGCGLGKREEKESSENLGPKQPEKDGTPQQSPIPLQTTYHGVKVRFLIGAGGSLELGSLDLGAGHLLAKKDLAAKEQFMVVTRGIRTAGKTREPIKVELTLEGSQLGLTKVSGFHCNKRESGEIVSNAR